MEYIKAEVAAKKWNMSLRRVQDLCKEGKVFGAQKFGTNWMIPETATRPLDGRRKDTKQIETATRPLIRKSPFLDMTDLYSEPGRADECADALYYHPEAQALFRAQIAYSRGEIDKVYEYAQHFLDSHSGFYAMISGGMLLSLCAIWHGDDNMWNKARQHICDAPCEDLAHADILELSLAVGNSALRITGEYPEWFTRGCFDSLPHDAHPAARVYYVKYLLIIAQELALGNISFENVKGIGLMKTLPYIIEPMITQMTVDKIIIAEIYLRLFCAVAYNQCGDRRRAEMHLDKAIDLCLPDRLYGPLVETRRQLGMLLDERLAIKDADALKRVKELHKTMLDGWTKLHNAVLKKTVSVSLSAREREIARLASFGMTDTQISEQLFISISSVKSIIRSAKNKTGVEKRSQLSEFI